MERLNGDWARVQFWLRVAFTFYFFSYVKSSCVLLFVVFLMKKEIKKYWKKKLLYGSFCRQPNKFWQTYTITNFQLLCKVTQSINLSRMKFFQNQKNCGRQPLKNLKGYGLLKQTISFQIFLKAVFGQKIPEEDFLEDFIYNIFKTLMKHLTYRKRVENGFSILP